MGLPSFFPVSWPLFFRHHLDYLPQISQYVSQISSPSILGRILRLESVSNVYKAIERSARIPHLDSGILIVHGAAFKTNDVLWIFSLDVGAAISFRQLSSYEDHPIFFLAHAICNSAQRSDCFIFMAFLWRVVISRKSFTRD